MSGCNTSPVEGADSGDSSLSYICSALSQDDGTFAFPSLASGEYTVVSGPYFYKACSRVKTIQIIFAFLSHLFFGSASDPGAILQRGEDHLRCRSFEDGFQSGAQQFEAGGEEFDVPIDPFFFRATVLTCNANSLAPGLAHIPRHGLFRDGPSSQQPGGGRGARCLGIHQQSD